MDSTRAIYTLIRIGSGMNPKQRSFDPERDKEERSGPGWAHIDK